jgi:hypothetical protein
VIARVERVDPHGVEQDLMPIRRKTQSMWRELRNDG